MAAVPSIGRAQRVEGAPAPEADRTRDLYEQYAAQIFRYCLHQLGSREEAEDAVQSTFLNAFRGIKRGVVPELESAWLFKIAHNVCLSRRRSTWRRGRIESPADFDVVEELAPAPSRRADELIGLQDVLEQMPEQQRRAILLREWQGLSYREIADELELSQAAVETLIFRARRALAQGLEQPPVPQRRARVRRHGGVLANLLSSAQSFLLGGGAAVKVAATVAVVGAGAVVATAPVVKQQGPTGHTQPAAPIRVDHVQPQQPSAGTVVRPVRATPSAPAVVRHRRTAAPRPAVTQPSAPAPAPATAPTPSVASAPQPAENASPPAATTPPSARGRGTAPGQAKKADRRPPAAGHEPTAATGNGNADHGDANGRGNGRESAPGQVKKADPPSIPVGTAIPSVPPVTAPVDPAPGEDVTGPPADSPGNGRGKNDK